MKQKIIISNIRVPENDWLQVKAAAAEAKMSVNEYLKRLINDSVRKKFFAYRERKITKKTKKTRLYQSLWDLLEKPYKRKPMGASEEDKAIYDI